jgi:hypothetical protein
MTTSSPSGKYEEALRETAPPPHGPTEAVVTVPRKGRRRLVPGTEGEQNADVDTLIQNSQSGDKVSCSPDKKRSLLLVVQVVPRTNTLQRARMVMNHSSWEATIAVLLPHRRWVGLRCTARSSWTSRSLLLEKFCRRRPRRLFPRMTTTLRCSVRAQAEPRVQSEPGTQTELPNKAQAEPRVQSEPGAQAEFTTRVGPVGVSRSPTMLRTRLSSLPRWWRPWTTAP